MICVAVKDAEGKVNEKITLGERLSSAVNTEKGLVEGESQKWMNRMMSPDSQEFVRSSQQPMAE